MENKTIFETGATDHAVNDLILVADNTRELAALRDDIYKSYLKDEGYQRSRHNLQERFVKLWAEAATNYKRNFPNTGDHGHITNMTEDQRKEFCKMYADGLDNWIFDQGLPRLEELRRLAERAHYGTSHSPEKRGDSIVRDFSEQLETDLKAIPKEEHKRYEENFRSKLTAWLHAKSNCISSMIAGPSNFPVRRAEKANRSEELRYSEFSEWRTRALNAIEKKKLADRSPEQVVNERWNQVKSGLMSSAAVIVGLDTGLERGYSRALFVSSITNKIKTLAKNGETELVNLALNLIRDLNEKYENPIIAAKNSIWQLGEKAEAKREQIADNAVRENEEKKIGDATIVLNFAADRVQINFPGKPDYNTIQALKKNAWKWSPSNMAWQRKLTRAAQYDAELILNKMSNGN